MVSNEKQHRKKEPAKQAFRETPSEPNKIGASTPYQFSGKNLTAYGGLLPVATMLEKLGFQALVEETITCNRETRVMSLYKFVLGIVLGLYIGFPRLNQLRFIAADPMLTGILKEPRLPPQSTLWRFMAALHLNVAAQILSIQRSMRQRVWQAANIRLQTVTLDTDTTVHTLYGNQMGARKSYNPKNKGKKSYQPMLTFIAETREYVWGELRNGDRPTGKQIYDHLKNAIAALPAGIQQVSARADSGFYCSEAVGGLRRDPMRICHRRAKDLAISRAIGTGRMEGFAENRCRRAMRVPVSAGRVGKSVPVYRVALCQGRGARTGGQGSVSTVRNASL